MSDKPSTSNKKSICFIKPVFIFLKLRHSACSDAGKRSYGHIFAVTNDKKTARMKCPNCNEVLVMSERQGVEIDYCPTCRGVWLDKGELDKIIEKAAANETRAAGDVSDPFRENDNKTGHYNKQDPYYGRRKKKGFLGDFFDFD